MSKVFISHSSKDKVAARYFADALEQEGHQIWMDERSIAPVGPSLIESLASGLEECDYLLVLLSRNSVVSNWVQKEMNAKLLDEIKTRRVTVLPVLLEECTLPVFLREKMYLDCTEGVTEPKLRDLFRALKLLGKK
jgi:hypothetical protein